MSARAARLVVLAVAVLMVLFAVTLRLAIDVAVSAAYERQSEVPALPPLETFEEPNCLSGLADAMSGACIGDGGM